MSKTFLEGYGGQAIAQLIAMKDSHRVDSLVLAVEQALGGKRAEDLSEPERVVLAVEAMEREVNNGGYEQFFFNSSREFTGLLVEESCLGGALPATTRTTRTSSSVCLPTSRRTSMRYGSRRRLDRFA